MKGLLAVRLGITMAVTLAAGAAFAQGSCRRACKASMLSAGALIACCKSPDSSNASRTLAIFVPFRSSLETGATINTHRYATPQGV